MKGVYWRPQGTPRFAFVVIALFAVLGLLLVEYFKVVGEKPFYNQKIAASRLALQAMQVIRSERLQRGIPIDTENDPAQSGLIGFFITPVTSDPGDLAAKQTTINPNFAAVVVDLLKEAGVQEGDMVAVSFSGSFPALNIAVGAALRVLNLSPVIISSASASQWGANHPKLLWLDMEGVLSGRSLIPFTSVAASLGGKGDRGREMTEKGRQQVLDAINRRHLQVISGRNVTENIDQRMEIYFRAGRPKVFVNVGGGLAATGIRPFKILLRPGLLPKDLPLDTGSDSVISRFLKDGIPVIHLGNIRELASRYGLPVTPVSIPEVGEGNVYLEKRHNYWIAGGVLLGIILGLHAFSRRDWGFRIFLASTRKEAAGPPEPMV